MPPAKAAGLAGASKSDTYDFGWASAASTAFFSAAGCRAKSFIHNFTHGRTGAHEVAIAIRVIDAPDRGEELEVAQPRRRISRLLAGIFVRPCVARHRRDRMR